jgi:hypothetical protein
MSRRGAGRGLMDVALSKRIVYMGMRFQAVTCCYYPDSPSPLFRN